MTTTEMDYDKSKMGEGPWMDEPDRLEWRYRGYPCLIVRGPMGALCGYAAVTEGHPFFERDCENTASIDVHGGLTYAEHCAGHICHVPQEGESDNVWWLGFDCAHFEDYLPRSPNLMPSVRTVYRDIEYVKKEVQSLVDQLIEAAK